jgi:hypothetical protein
MYIILIVELRLLKSFKRGLKKKKKKKSFERERERERGAKQRNIKKGQPETTLTRLGP